MVIILRPASQAEPAHKLHQHITTSRSRGPATHFCWLSLTHRPASLDLLLLTPPAVCVCVCGPLDLLSHQPTDKVGELR